MYLNACTVFYFCTHDNNIAVGFLNPKKSLKQQLEGINKATELTLNLRKRLFFTETINCSCHNEKDLNLTYLQLRNAVVTGICSCTFEKAIELAALQCCIEYENCNIDEDFLDSKLKSLLPRKYAKVQGITSTILRANNSLELGQRSNAKSEYIRVCTTLDRYGITCFSGKVWILELYLCACIINLHINRNGCL